jgi:hypothetical protein
MQHRKGGRIGIGWRMRKSSGGGGSTGEGGLDWRGWARPGILIFVFANQVKKRRQQWTNGDKVVATCTLLSPVF